MVGINLNRVLKFDDVKSFKKAAEVVNGSQNGNTSSFTKQELSKLKLKQGLRKVIVSGKK